MTSLEISHDPRAATAESHLGCKLVVVIPALDEEQTIGSVIAGVPRRIPGVNEVEVLLVDDGSRDETPVRALAAGVDGIVRHARNRGLVAAFNAGIAEALRRGADIVVHLDGDGQHDPRLIPEVTAPIVAGDADMVVGVRRLAAAHGMSAVRRHGNRFGSWFLRRALRLPVSDVTSGYRAFSRESLLQMNVVSEYTYTLETLIQAARKRLAVAEVEVSVLERTAGTSRMTGSVVRYISRTGGQAVRSLLHANPLAVFGRAALILLLVAGGCTGKFVWAYNIDGGLHLPALLGAILAAILSMGLFIAGLISDGINSNRRLTEEALYRLKCLELAASSNPPPHEAIHEVPSLQEAEAWS